VTDHECDALVIGSGIAGLSFALRAAEQIRVAIVTKKERAASNTNYAQGGIAAVMGKDDQPELHIRDTILSGAGLCRPEAVHRLVREGPARVRELTEWGARFTTQPDGYALGIEGGHSRRRIVHAADLTGREIERALLQAAGEHPRIEMFEDHVALDLLIGFDLRSGLRRCGGALVLEHPTGRVLRCHATATLLAAGGVGRAYRHTTNPEIATGDGLAIAYRAGAEMANLEFIQFHPTALHPTDDRAVLISEAVRGEGAVLLRANGQPLMEGVPHGSLATRDVVARTIDAALKEYGDEYALLDLSPIDPDVAERKFPNILAECRLRGREPLNEPVPVVPAAHYSCGGVRTDADGRTSVPGLFAAGEVAYTGVHGANRLASNSLLEALVFSHRAAEAIRDEVARWPRTAPLAGATQLEGYAGAPARGPVPTAGELEAAVRDLMWEDAGIVRTTARLERARDNLQVLRQEALRLLYHETYNVNAVEARNLIEAALLIVSSAALRAESRGLHYNTDYPYRDNERFLRDTVLAPPGAADADVRFWGGRA
jgi:L-aspartate oxidase